MDCDVGSGFFPQGPSRVRVRLYCMDSAKVLRQGQGVDAGVCPYVHKGPASDPFGRAHNFRFPDALPSPNQGFEHPVIGPWTMRLQSSCLILSWKTSGLKILACSLMSSGRYPVSSRAFLTRVTASSRVLYWKPTFAARTTSPPPPSAGQPGVQPPAMASTMAMPIPGSMPV